MKIKSLILAGLAALACSTAFAQETNKDANGKRIYGPYETNRFCDNWFIGVGGGLNLAMDEGFASIKDPSRFKYGAGLDLEFSFGKWFTPCWGARLGWAGLRTGNIAHNPHFGEVPGKMGFNYIHADVLWNVSHQFAGYKELRRVNVIPYFTAGMIGGKEHGEGASKEFKRGFGMGAGVMVPIRCTDLISFVPDVRYIGMNGSVVNGDGLTGQFTASVGLQFNLARRNWTRKATTVAKYDSMIGEANAARDAAQAQSDKLAAEKAAAEAKAAQLSKENTDLKKKLSEAEAKKGIDLAENPVAAYFEIGQTVLTDKEKAHFLYNVENIIKDNTDVQLILTGSADKFGATNRRNAKLAQKRAEHVINILVNECGLSADNFRITTVVVGCTDPLSRAVIISK